MRIIEPGVIPNFEYIFNCKRCGCKFAITEQELKDSPYVNKTSYKCPTCATQVFSYTTELAEDLGETGIDPELEELDWMMYNARKYKIRL